MARAGSSFFTVTDGPPAPRAGLETRPTIIWLRGEHDIATDGALRRTLERAIALNDAALVVDLTKVELLSASTIGVILAARDTLQQQSRSLTMRAPSPHVRRVIGICGLQHLLIPEGPDEMAGVVGGPDEMAGVVGEALGSWVEVRDAVPGGRQPGPSTPAPNRVPVHAGQAARWREAGPDKMPT
jgi:anti-anti-sigma factor